MDIYPKINVILKLEFELTVCVQDQKILYQLLLSNSEVFDDASKPLT